jgi:hypothetical protein
MRKLTSILVALSLVVVGVIASGTISMAAPHQGNPGTDFVCPVIPSQAVGEHNPIAGPLGDTGTYTVVPATSQANQMNVPDYATNMDGTGVPGGPQAAPGDTDYTAIWNGQ